MEVCLNSETKYIYSTSGSQSSIVKYNKGLQSLGLNNLVYFTFPESISAEIYAGCLRAPFCRGGAVTAHDGLKSKIIPYLDVVEPLALQCRAVNTVVRMVNVDDDDDDDGNGNAKLYGYNTDVHGLRRALQKGLKEYYNKNENCDEIKTAAIYGNGGVSGVAWYVLKELLGSIDGGKVTIIGRNPERVALKRKELGINDVDDPHFDAPYDIVIDATPLACCKDWPQEFTSICSQAKIVFCHSMPEKENKVNHLKQFCEQRDISFIPGIWMNVGQMVKQYSLYFAQEKEKIITEEDICSTWNLELP